MDINNLSIQKNENLFKEQLGDFSKEGILNGYFFVKDNGSLAQTNILKYLVEKFKARWGYKDSTNPHLLKLKTLQFINSGRLPPPEKTVSVDKHISAAWSPLSKVAVVTGALIAGLTATYLARQVFETRQVFENGVPSDQSQKPGGMSQEATIQNNSSTAVPNNSSTAVPKSISLHRSPKKNEWPTPFSELSFYKQLSSSKNSEKMDFPFPFLLLTDPNRVFMQNKSHTQIFKNTNDSANPQVISNSVNESGPITEDARMPINSSTPEPDVGKINDEPNFEANIETKPKTITAQTVILTPVVEEQSGTVESQKPFEAETEKNNEYRQAYSFNDLVKPALGIAGMAAVAATVAYALRGNNAPELNIEAEIKKKTECDEQLNIEEQKKIEEAQKLQIKTEKKEKAKREEKLRVEAELKEKTEREDKLKIEKENAERDEQLKIEQQKKIEEEKAQLKEKLEIDQPPSDAPPIFNETNETMVVISDNHPVFNSSGVYEDFLEIDLPPFEGPPIYIETKSVTSDLVPNLSNHTNFKLGELCKEVYSTEITFSDKLAIMAKLKVFFSNNKIQELCEDTNIPSNFRKPLQSAMKQFFQTENIDTLQKFSTTIIQNLKIYETELKNSSTNTDKDQAATKFAEAITNQHSLITDGVLDAAFWYNQAFTDISSIFTKIANQIKDTVTKNMEKKTPLPVPMHPWKKYINQFINKNQDLKNIDVTFEGLFIAVTQRFPRLQLFGNELTRCDEALKNIALKNSAETFEKKIRNRTSKLNIQLREKDLLENGQNIVKAIEESKKFRHKLSFENENSKKIVAKSTTQLNKNLKFDVYLQAQKDLQECIQILTNKLKDFKLVQYINETNADFNERKQQRENSDRAILDSFNNCKARIDLKVNKLTKVNNKHNPKILITASPENENHKINQGLIISPTSASNISSSDNKLEDNQSKTKAKRTNTNQKIKDKDDLLKKKNKKKIF